ncbi:MAG TPA: hypothetical protein VGP26_30980 [Actinophytocola sp.]|nr:hypothetical protein [Actinophytocola sp.]
MIVAQGPVFRDPPVLEAHRVVVLDVEPAAGGGVAEKLAACVPLIVPALSCSPTASAGRCSRPFTVRAAGG